MGEKENEFMTRAYNTSRRNVYKKISKPVIWNGQEFESGRALGRHLKLPGVNAVSGYISKKKPLKGHVPKFKK